MKKKVRKRSDGMISFWEWFFKGSNANSKPGYRRLISKWLILDLVIAVSFLLIINKSLSSIANKVFFPLLAVFVGISATWCSLARATIDTDEIRDLGEFHAGGYREYPYAMQVAVLTLLTTLVLWGLAATGIIDLIVISEIYLVVSILLYALVSCSIRMCWQMIMYAQNLLIIKNEIIKKRNKK